MIRRRNIHMLGIIKENLARNNDRGEREGGEERREKREGTLS